MNDAKSVGMVAGVLGGFFLAAWVREELIHWPLWLGWIVCGVLIYGAAILILPDDPV